MEHAVALDLTVPGVVSDGGMVSMVSAIQALYYRVRTRKFCEIIEIKRPSLLSL